MLETIKRDGTDFYLNLLNLWNIPRDKIMGSPTERWLSRWTQTALPVCKQLLKQQPSLSPAHKEVRSTETLPWQDQQSTSSPYTKPSGKTTKIRRTWQNGGCMEKVWQATFIKVESEGKEYRRNRRLIVPVMEPQPPKPITHTWTKHKWLKNLIRLSTHYQSNVKKCWRDSVECYRSV